MDPRDAGRTYVEKMREEGYSDADIREALTEAGWTEDQIERAMAPDAEGPPPPPPREAPPPSERRPPSERPPARKKSGEGTAVWVLVLVGCLGMTVMVGAILAAILFPVFARAREKARQTSCLANLKQIGLAQLMYAQDYPGGNAPAEKLPPAAQWPEKLHPYINNPMVYTCPTDERANPPTWQGSPVSYTMDSALGGADLTTLAAPASTPMCYDGTAISGGAGDAAFRHNEGANCVFVDGHAKWVHRGSWNAMWSAPPVGAGVAPPPAQTPRPVIPGPAPPQPLPSDEPPEVNSQEDARAGTCLRNQRQLCLAMMMYTTDYDGVAPGADAWPEAIQMYLGPNYEGVRELYLCPSDDQPHGSQLRGWDLSYTMNDALGGQRIRERSAPAHEVMLFDGSALSGGRDAAEFRHAGGLYAGYADGHVSRVEESEWAGEWGQ